MPDDPITFVIERRHGRESACIIFGPLPEWLTAKGSGRMVYALRLDKLPNGAALAGKSIDYLQARYIALRDAGKLPPSNLADPPRPKEERNEVRRGPTTWWRPTPLPHGQDWTPDPQRSGGR
jgi:hypothetical protein